MNCNLGKHWETFVRNQISSGRYQNQSEVIRDALRLLEQKELEQFHDAFPAYEGAPAGEPRARDLKRIRTVVRSTASAKPHKKAA